MEAKNHRVDQAVSGVGKKNRRLCLGNAASRCSFSDKRDEPKCLFWIKRDSTVLKFLRIEWFSPHYVINSVS